MSGWENDIAIAAGISAALLLCGMEIRRSKKTRLWWRLAASVLLAVSILALALPSWFSTSMEVKTVEHIILTDGYDPDSLAAFAHHHGNPPVEQADTMLDPADIDKADVFGNGFTQAELSAMPPVYFHFHPAENASGILHANWKRHLPLGERLHVQGEVSNNTSGNSTIMLTGTAGHLDSISIGPRTTVSFDLSFIPKQEGRQVYQLLLIKHKGLTATEPVPVTVDKPRALRILMLSGTPGFESRFLHNWLTGQGDSVISNTLVSRNKYLRSAPTGKDTSNEQLSAHLLQGMDVLIADGPALTALDKAARQSLQDAVNQGLGLVVMADSSYPAFYFRGTIHSSPDSVTRLVHLHVSGGQDTFSLPVAGSSLIAPGDLSQPLIMDTHGNRYAVLSLEDEGRILLCTLGNTYTWQLSGKKDTYSRFWSLLLSEAARARPAPLGVEFSPAFPVAGEPVNLRIEHESDSVPAITTNGAMIYFSGQKYLPFEWTAPGWFGRGWQGDQLSDWFVYGSEDWKTVRSRERIEQTQNYLRVQQAIAPVAGNTSLQQVVIPRFYFVLIILLCLAFLWIERKLD